MVPKLKDLETSSTESRCWAQTLPRVSLVPSDFIFGQVVLLSWEKSLLNQVLHLVFLLLSLSPDFWEGCPPPLFSVLPTSFSSLGTLALLIPLWLEQTQPPGVPAESSAPVPKPRERKQNCPSWGQMLHPGPGPWGKGRGCRKGRATGCRVGAGSHTEDRRLLLALSLSLLLARRASQALILLCRLLAVTHLPHAHWTRFTSNSFREDIRFDIYWVLRTCASSLAVVRILPRRPPCGVFPGSAGARVSCFRFSFRFCLGSVSVLHSLCFQKRQRVADTFNPPSLPILRSLRLKFLM